MLYGPACSAHSKKVSPALPRSRSALVLTGLAAVLLIALFLLLRPVQAPVPATENAPRTIALTVKQGRLVSGPAVIQARIGDALRISIISDRPDHWHLHGYDLELALEASQPATLSFKADRSGRFEHELHHAHKTLGTLEVVPR